MLTQIQAQQSFKKPINGENIKVARDEFKKLSVHIDGVGVEKYLEKIEGLENEEQLKLRRKHKLSNKHTYGKVLQPKNQIFSVTGSNFTIDIPDSLKEEYWKKVDTVKDGNSLKNYLDQQWLHRVDVDANGLLFFEISKDGQDCYPTYKSINCVRDYYVEAGQIKWVVFEPETHTDADGNDYKTVRAIDEVADYMYLVKDDELVLIDEQTIPNPWGYVPAIFNSTRYHSIYPIYRSYVDESVELADALLIDNTVHTIYKFLHGYPIFWRYIEACTYCNDGFIHTEGEIDVKCPKCHGTGYKLTKDVSDIISLPIPENPEDPTLAPNVAGYIQPDIATWQQQNIESELMHKAVEFACWGTNTVANEENETATARFLDIQPVNNKLNKYADNAEIIYSFCLKVIGNFYFPNSFKSAHVKLGRRYVIESPDALFQKYTDAREQGNSDIVLNYLYKEYLSAEHQNDPQMFEYQVKLMRIQPFFHNTIAEVKDFEIDKADYFAKAYFNQWLSTISYQDALMKTEDELKELLYTYVEPKINKNAEIQGNSE